MDRRTFLATAPAVLVAGTVPAIAASADTPVAALFRDWRAARAEETRLHQTLPIGPVEDAAIDAAGDRRGLIEDALLAAPSESAHDWLLKLAAWTNFGMFNAPDESQNPQLWAEARRMIGGAA